MSHPDRIQCFYLDPTSKVRVSLRRYAGQCPHGGCHDTSVVIGEETVLAVDQAVTLSEISTTPAVDVIEPHDSRWPVLCSHCDYIFSSRDARQRKEERIYRRSDTGELITLKEAPLGAMWYADAANEWYKRWKGSDGKSLIVRTPGGDWAIDTRAANCDSKCVCGVPYVQHNNVPCKHYVDARPHNCWIRHGIPPLIHVDKNGKTCGAGAGSWIGYKDKWHGFLHDGVLISC